MRTHKLANCVTAFAHDAGDHGHGAALANGARDMHGLHLILRIAKQREQLAHAIQFESVVRVLNIANLFVVGSIMQPTQAQWVGRQIWKFRRLHFGLGFNRGLHSFQGGFNGLFCGRA